MTATVTESTHQPPTTVLRGGIGEGRLLAAPRPRKATKPDPQAIVTAFVARYGANVWQWPEWPLMVENAGLSLKEITPDMLSRADQEIRDRQAKLNPLTPSRRVLLQMLPVGGWFRIATGKKGQLLGVNECEAHVAVYGDGGKPQQVGWSLNTEVEMIDAVDEERARVAAEVAQKEEQRNRMEEARKARKPSTNGKSEKTSHAPKVQRTSEGVDSRTPPVGTVLTKRYKGVDYSVKVIDGGFEYAGEVFTSLSKVGMTITGSQTNGFVFFGLGKKTD